MVIQTHLIQSTLRIQTENLLTKGSGGSKGGRGTCALPPGPKFLHFNAVFRKNWPNNRLAPPPLGNPGSATERSKVTTMTLMSQLSLETQKNFSHAWLVSSNCESTAKKEEKHECWWLHDTYVWIQEFLFLKMIQVIHNGKNFIASHYTPDRTVAWPVGSYQ